MSALTADTDKQKLLTVFNDVGLEYYEAGNFIGGSAIVITNSAAGDMCCLIFNNEEDLQGTSLP